MQRKRNRVHYADTIESGTNLIPVSRGLMRKLKMKSFLKYAIVGIICFTVFSLYEKVMVVSIISFTFTVSLIVIANLEFEL